MFLFANGVSTWLFALIALLILIVGIVSSEDTKKYFLYVTEVLLAKEKAKVAESLGLDSDGMVQYLWIQALLQKEQLPGTIILSTGDNSVAVR